MGPRPSARAVPSRGTLGAVVLIAIGLLLTAVAVLVLPETHDAGPPAASDLRSATVGVNPFSAYSAEPAPVGITDFGIGPGDAPYEYNTTQWLDGADFSKLNVNGTNLGVSSEFFPAEGLGVTLQQNVVLVFNLGGTLYYYWIQNVAGLTPGGCPPGTNLFFKNNQWEILVGSCPGNPAAADHDTLSYIYFVDNIWNFSASGVEGAPIYSSSVEGNGMVYGDLVYASAAENLPGNQVNLTFPAEVDLKVVTSRGDAGPKVAFEYNDGFGWQTYDTAYFPFAFAASSLAFQVNGYSYNPDGHFTDSELDLGGFGDGTYSALNATSVYFSMQYWNGHNWETPANGFNFGGDTAESVDYAASGPVFHHGSGNIGERIVNSSKTTLEQVFTRAQDAQLVVNMPVAAGIITWGGKRYPFVGSKYRQILVPATYSFQVYRGSHLLYASPPVTLTAGGATTVTA